MVDSPPGAAITRGDALHLPLQDGTVDLVVTSPPYFALRSYRDDGEHYGGQIGSETTPLDFLRALWAVTDECWRVLKPSGSCWINLGDKYAGSGGHNNDTLTRGNSTRVCPSCGRAFTSGRNKCHVCGVTTRFPAGARTKATRATRRQAPDRYTQAADVRVKSLMGLPWRFAMGLLCPDLYRAPFEPAACWHDDGPGPCRTCSPRRFPQWIARAEVVWAKPNGLPESVTDRVRRSHEQWFHLTKAPRYFAGIDEIREAQTGPKFAGKAGVNAPGSVSRDSHDGAGHRSVAMADHEYNPLGKLPGSVWSIPSAPLRVPQELGVDHFAAFPPEWPRRIIAGWSPTGICTACGEGRRPVVAKTLEVRQVHLTDRQDANDDNAWGASWRTQGGATLATISGYACACPDTSAPTRPAVVLDPFSGTGTVAMMAQAMGRFGVGIDLSRDYNRLATWRVFESGHGEKALQKVAGKPGKKRAVRRGASLTLFPT